MASALKGGEKKAITFLREGKGETQISYQGLDRDSNRVANIFLDLGVEKGDRVILFFPKPSIFVIAYLRGKREKANEQLSQVLTELSGGRQT
jgi:acyl-coenzyme A synthetase/AMP-(fatty) acid ligase